MTKRMNNNKKTKQKKNNNKGSSLINVKKVSETENVYMSNMKALREMYPDLAEKVDKTPLNNNYKLLYSGVQSKPNLFCLHENYYYYERDHIDEDVEKQIKALNLKNARLAVFLGIGLGYELLYYMQKVAAEQNTNNILIIEKDMEIFKAAMEAINLVPAINHPGVRFIVGEVQEEMYTRLRKYMEENSRYAFVKAIKAVYHTSALKLNKDYYIQSLKNLREAASHQVLHYGNDPYDSLIGIENMLDNINEIILNPGIKLLYNKFAGKPAVVVSTGPSLNKNKHLLKGLEDKALIIAADASLKVLMKMDFKPHMVTSLERISEVTNLFEGFSHEEVEDVYMAACPVVLNEVYQSYPGPRIIVYRNFDHFKWLGIDKGILDIKLSSGNMAFKVAQALGCDPIILIGQDLAFSRDGRTHAEGMVFGEMDQVELGSNKIAVKGNDGQPIVTTPTWYSFLKAYELDIAGHNGKCINSTEGGAFIQGTEVMPFQEAIDKYVKENFDPLDILKENLSLFSVREAEKDLRKTVELIDYTIRDMQEIVLTCQNGLEINEKYSHFLVDILRKPENMLIQEGRLRDIEMKIMSPKENFRKMYHTVQLFFAHVYQSYVINHEIDNIAIPEKYDDKELAKAEILLRQGEWYAVLGDLANICLNSLIRAREKLNNILIQENIHLG